MSPEPPRKFERRTVLVKRALQIKYMGMVFLSVLLASVLVGFDVYHTMAGCMLKDNPGLLDQIAPLHHVMIFKIFLYLLLIILITLYVSHRIAGPIYRFEKSAQIVSSGDLTHRVSLRTGDELTELQEEFNGMLANLQALVRKDRGIAAELRGRIDALLAAPPDGPLGEKLRRDLEILKRDLDLITKAFKV